MQSPPRMAPLLALLKGRPRVVAIEAVYFVCITLSHLLTRKRLLSKMGIEETVPGRKPAHELAIEIVSEIERIEGGEITQLSAETRMGYALRLADLIVDTGDTDGASPADVEAALRELEAAL